MLCCGWRALKPLAVQEHPTDLGTAIKQIPVSCASWKRNGMQANLHCKLGCPPRAGGSTARLCLHA